MDNLVGFKTRLDPKPKRTAAEAVELIKDVFVTAGERDIYTGDAVEICVITAAGSETQASKKNKNNILKCCACQLGSATPRLRCIHFYEKLVR